jgi:hypothetical protein
MLKICLLYLEWITFNKEKICNQSQFGAWFILYTYKKKIGGWKAFFQWDIDVLI